MKKLILLLLFTTFSFSQEGLPHCGYDFTTYLVANPIDAISKKIIDGNPYLIQQKPETLNLKQIN